MTTLLALFALAAAARPAPVGAWPAGVPLVFAFTFEALYGVVQDVGNATFVPGRAEPYTWTCEAKPAAGSGRQEMTCVEPGLGTVRIVWGPERHIRALEVEQENGRAQPMNILDERRAGVLAGALELWPAASTSGAAWKLGGNGQGVRVAHTVAPTSFVITHVVTASSPGRVTVRTEGTGPLAGGFGHSEVKVDGEAVFDLASGLLVDRWVLVQPAKTVVGMFGIMGHKVTVEVVGR